MEANDSDKRISSVIVNIFSKPSSLDRLEKRYSMWAIIYFTNISNLGK
jgi:hypothetical protein